MKWSEKEQCWCVIPIGHENIMDVVDWCTKLFGPCKITGKRNGTWSWSDGKFYGLKRKSWDDTIEWMDERIYFSFKDKSDVTFFACKWGIKHE